MLDSITVSFKQYGFEQGYDRDSAFVYNQGIVTQNEYEEFERTVNHIYLSTIAKQIYQLNSTDSATVFSIANMCPALGGSAVYMARSIVVLFNDTLAFDDDSLCVAQGVLLRQALDSSETTANNSKGVNVYPNPTNDVLYITFGDDLVDLYIVEIFDMFGKVCYKSNLNSQLNSISLNGILNNSGIYSYRIHSNTTNKMYKGKINFIKY